MKKLNRLSLVLSICIGILATAPAASQTTSQQGAKKFGTLLSMLDRLYVDRIEMDKLVETAIVKMLEELDESDRQLVKLKYFSNLKYREISSETGLNVGNIGYRLHHILKELADKLRKLGFDEKP